MRTLLVAFFVALAAAPAAAQDVLGLSPEVRKGLDYAIRRLQPRSCGHMSDWEIVAMRDARKAWPVLVEKSASLDDDVRLQAVRGIHALWWNLFDHPEALRPLLLDVSRPIRLEAIAALQRAIRGRRAKELTPIAKGLVPTLRHFRHLGMEDPELGAWGGVLLARLGQCDDAFAAELWELTDHPDESIENHARLAFARSGWARVEHLPTLIERLHDRVHHSSELAIKSMGAEAFPAARELTRSGDQRRRAAGVAVLRANAKLLGPEELQVLMQVARSGEKELSATAAYAIGAAAGASGGGVTMLAELLRDGGDRVKAAARAALHRLGPAAAPVAHLLLADARVGTAQARAWKVRYLSNLGTAGISIYPEVLAMMSDPNPAVSFEAARAVVAIEGDPSRAWPVIRSRLGRDPKAGDWKSWSAQYGVFRWIGELGEDAAPLVPDLIAVGQRSERWRPAVCGSLEKIPIEAWGEHAGVLRAWRDGKDPRARVAACRSLWHLYRQADDVLPTLREVLRAISAQPRVSSTMHLSLVLAKLGPAMAPAAPELEALLQSNDRRLAEDACYAFAWMKGAGVAHLPMLRKHRETAPPWLWYALDKSISTLEKIERGQSGK